MVQPIQKEITMNNLPTAEEYLLSKGFSGFAKHTLTKKWLIEFAKIHCEAQQKAILENVTIDDIGSPNGDGEWMPCNIINQESILNAYDLNNIK